MLRRALVPLVLLSLLAFAPPASATVVQDAAKGLSTDSLYVHPDVKSALTSEQAADLRRRIETSGAGALYIAVLPARVVEEGDGDLQGVIIKLAAAADGLGIFAVAVPDGGFMAASNTMGDPGVPGAASAALEAHSDDGMYAMIGDFVDRVSALSDSGAQGDANDSSDGSSIGGVGIGAIILLGVGALAVGTVLMTGRERRRLQGNAFAEVKDNARDDLVALGDEVRALDLDTELPGAPQAAIDDHAVALAAYERAERAWKAAHTPAELEPVSMALEEGRWALASARARMEGEDPPVRRPPCFFDPRHGPSSRDVEWGPPYGKPRLVPACEADAQRVVRGDDPHAREVLSGGRRVPYWHAGPAYGPFAGGFFGGRGATLLPSLLVGSMLGLSLASMADTDALGADGGDFGSGDLGGGELGGDTGGGGGDLGGGMGGGGGDFGGGGGFGGGNF